MSALIPAPETVSPVIEQRTYQIDTRFRVLRTLLDDDETEQRETFEYLQHVLDEDRSSTRKLFQTP